VIKINTESRKFISIHFDKENFGIESYGFAKIISEGEIKLVKTKFIEKTCDCQKYGTYEKSYFITNDDFLIRIYTDVSNSITNKSEINNLLKENGCETLPENIKTIKDLVFFYNK
jgi:hypothetical protein